MPQIEVGFDIDANGIVHVAAKDLGTGKEQKITITASSGLSKDEVNEMVSDAADHAEEDRQAREAADVRNQADQMVYQVEKTLKENEPKFSEEDRATVEQAVKETREALEKGDVEQIKAASERLEKASHRLAEVMYRSQPDPEASAGPGGDADAAGGADDVIDAEVVEDAKPS
jgi:molecular chaperone DnaK